MDFFGIESLAEAFEERNMDLEVKLTNSHVCLVEDSAKLERPESLPASLLTLMISLDVTYTHSWRGNVKPEQHGPGTVELMVDLDLQGIYVTTEGFLKGHGTRTNVVDPLAVMLTIKNKIEPYLPPRGSFDGNGSGFSRHSSLPGSILIEEDGENGSDSDSDLKDLQSTGDDAMSRRSTMVLSQRRTTRHLVLGVHGSLDNDNIITAQLSIPDVQLIATTVKSLLASLQKDKRAQSARRRANSRALPDDIDEDEMGEDEEGGLLIVDQEIEASEIRVILVNNRLDTPIVQLLIGCSQDTPGISVLLLNDGTGKGVQGKTDIEAKLDYFNPSVSCYEPLIEQLNIWAMLSPRHNHGQPQIELEMENVLNINLSQSFLSLATSDALKADHVTSSTTQFAPYLVVNG